MHKVHRLKCLQNQTDALNNIARERMGGKWGGNRKKRKTKKETEIEEEWEKRKTQRERERGGREGKGR